MERIQGRTALVTGAASGIGLAVAEALVEAGARVAMLDVDTAGVEAESKRLGAGTVALTLDVTDRAAWGPIRKAAEAELGPVEILVNNAGIGPDLQPLADVDPETFDRLVAVKLTGTFNGVHTFAAAMRDRGDGHIVNTASMAGLTASPRLGPYTASKFAVVGLSEVLRAEMEPHGVGVSVLCPGMVRTNLPANTARLAGQPDPETPMGGIEPAIVGRLVVDAIRSNQLYIITHGEYRDLVAARVDQVVAAFDGAHRNL